ncbi:hypothetical protein QBC47DRAFT_168368 [Echria macrotheca]|uniref:Uncharacterized protein n=1 Tax=Echria macrotheca TaxID=438768 RepID=A0AAJ0BE89_9PEZI|nr:hypothetical protein QBC47DRAFT_168368 [Echria macrotheca]
MIRSAASPNPQRYTIRIRPAGPVLPPNTTTMAATTSVGAVPDRHHMSPTSALHHNRDLALQKYLLLQEQHEYLRQHLDELRPVRSSSGSTATTSPASSPTRAGLNPGILGPSPISPHHHRGFAGRPGRRTSLPTGIAWGTELDTLPDGGILSQVAMEEARLCDVNEGIKRTLTELLNCETVREDQAFRTWVQRRLMDTERELRSGRRRRSAPEP